MFSRSASGSSEALLDVFGLCRLVPFLLLGAAHLAGQLHGGWKDGDGSPPAESLLKFLLGVYQEGFLSAY